LAASLCRAGREGKVRATLSGRGERVLFPPGGMILLVPWRETPGNPLLNPEWEKDRGSVYAWEGKYAGVLVKAGFSMIVKKVRRRFQGKRELSLRPWEAAVEHDWVNPASWKGREVSNGDRGKLNSRNRGRGAHTVFADDTVSGGFVRSSASFIGAIQRDITGKGGRERAI